ncbi:Glutathione S-transferase [Polaromonas sp. CG9_12]|uniref:glutathione S-transferase family protein n=1 Tax=Polaromonas sp. CG_9.11 TaxID=2787730 RepID=UPI0004DDC78C|nr:glutathione S-transferase family protein [Polaromonas sp. CG_9.11]MBG6076973.1 glutathione S-transferase [Polaromonas sp. CG_9.11]CDS54137.1 Glutathione S-transferase [Polaromonas sp. CG9_12]
MTLRIYGTAASRAARPLWVAQELGLAYEHIALPYVGGATRTPEFLKVNPNGRIPVVDDDGVLVWESMACTVYLAERFLGSNGLSLAARTHAERAEILRWTFWVVTECEKDALIFLMHAMLMPPERRKPQLAEESLRHLASPLRILDQHLQDRPWLAGDRFTVADICVASVIAWLEGASELMAQCPQVQGWLQGCLARPAFQQVRFMAKSA